MIYGLIALLAYLLGSSNLAYYLSRWLKKDISGNGSGNLGASNATILLGWRAGIAVGLHDMGKSALAVLLAGLLLPHVPYAGPVAGVACVLGHIFPFYLKFRGGKGFAAFLGMTFALNWKLALVMVAIIILVTAVTDYLVVGTVTTVLAVPICLGLSARSWILAGILLIASAAIIGKHWINFVRIFRGTEIGLQATLKGTHRI